MQTLQRRENVLTPEELAAFRRKGYHIQRGLFTPEEIRTLREFFDTMAAEGKPAPFDLWKPDLGADGSQDPLLRYPRVMHPHRFNEMCKAMMLHPGVHLVLRQLLDDEPFAAQSMYYFKPPGARGQALHQDNFYLAVKPFSCIAAWTAIDPALPENGGLFVVPETQDMDVVCPEKADPTESFYMDFVRPPAGKKAVPAELQPGDTLFFGGSVIHGSGPNRSKELWRRSFICHYLLSKAEYISRFYNPCFKFDGSAVEMPDNEDGGPCGKQWETSDPYGA